MPIIVSTNIGDVDVTGCTPDQIQAFVTLGHTVTHTND